jgi:catechol 1,2-dioxygenase
MRNLTIENVTEAVTAALGRSKDVPDRNKQIMTSLLRHLHDFCRETKITHQELIAACHWLVRAGHISDDARNEFILIADILGVEVLVDMLDHKVTEGESESTVLGPFFRENAPILAKGASIVQKDFEGTESLRVSGYVKDTNGRPVAGAMIDIWEDAPNGLYEQQDPDQPDYNLRGRFQTGPDGHYEFLAIRPVPYPIPYDGAGGELLNFMGHHPWRPGHIHFMVEKDGYQSLVSQIFDADTEYLDNDAVFAVKESLIGKLEKAPAGSNVDLVMNFDFILKTKQGTAAIAAE